MIPDEPPFLATMDDGIEHVLVESEQRLSRSLLWKLQRRYFDQEGIQAWRTTTVPHYVTNNPALAGAYAEVFFGFLRDCRDAGAEEPVTIVELGAGSGRFAFLFLKALTDLLRRSVLAHVRFRYVMTDFTETNLAYWRGHPALAPFIADGVLDFAVLDAENDREIRLREAGISLSPGSLRGPLGVIANYVFDGIAQDAFTFTGGELQECLISLSTVGAADTDDPSLIARLTPSFTRRPAPLAYYEDAELDHILGDYARTVQGTVLFPSSAIRCVGRLADLAGGRMLLLSGDRGHICEEAVVMEGDPTITVHGSFSSDVNYHAIAASVLARGGQVLKASHRHAHLNVVAFLLGEHPTGYVESRLAYERAVARSGPDDFFTMRRGIQVAYEQLDLEAILALIRASHRDPRILRDCLPSLWKHRETTVPADAREVVQLVMGVWDNYYSMGEPDDLAFELGLLAHAFGGTARRCGSSRTRSGSMGTTRGRNGTWGSAIMRWAPWTRRSRASPPPRSFSRGFRRSGRCSAKCEDHRARRAAAT
ncbi:TPR domain protein [Minicystis rosea]|nr:TPR domain protein [Minicystis rosea]